MRRVPIQIVICMVAAYFGMGILDLSPDPLPASIRGGEAAVLCAVSLFVLTRFNSVKSSPKSVYTLVFIFVCAISVLSVEYCWLRWVLTSGGPTTQTVTSVHESPTTRVPVQ
jgi:hypothetical protein